MRLWELVYSAHHMIAKEHKLNRSLELLNKLSESQVQHLFRHLNCRHCKRDEKNFCANYQHRARFVVVLVKQQLCFEHQMLLKLSLVTTMIRSSRLFRFYETN
eukprot:EC723803.1.p2 GENE.EC723803.1~~EC723803.1.p2  ORF type:complete len:103 (+),score=13.65 EC723803.1:118-426(+)